MKEPAARVMIEERNGEKHPDGTVECDESSTIELNGKEVR